MAQLQYCQKLDFEGYPINNLKYPNKKNTIFSISKAIKFQYIAQLKYCQKLDFEGYPINNLKYPNKKNSFLYIYTNIFKYDLIYIYINREPVVQYPNNKSVGLRGFY